jgi:hypothetical protein
MNYPRINKGLIIVGSGGHRDSSKMERERGGCPGSHQWRCLEAELQRWPHDGTQ